VEDGVRVVSMRRIARHAGRNLLEATIAPVVLFYVSMAIVGVWGALWVALIYTWGAIALRSATGQRIPGILVLGAVSVTARTALAMASGSVFVYFLQPTLSAFVLGFAFCSSVALRRPLAARLAADFCPLDADVAARPAVRRLCNRLSLLWGALNIVNGLMTIWLLTSQPVATFLWTKTVLSMSLTAVAATISIAAALRVGRAEGIFGRRGTLIRFADPTPSLDLAVAVAVA